MMTPRERRIMRELRDLLVKGELETYTMATVKIRDEAGEFVFQDLVPIKIKLKG